LRRLVERDRKLLGLPSQPASAACNQGRHAVMPWFNYLLSTLRRAYREFEDRAGRERPARGAKAGLIECALAKVQSPFGIADLKDRQDPCRTSINVAVTKDHAFRRVQGQAWLGFLASVFLE